MKRRHGAAGIVINPAGLSFNSIPVLDALKMFAGPIIELHISNIHRREAIYHRSLVSTVATAVIAGLGARGYATAVRPARDARRRGVVTAPETRPSLLLGLIGSGIQASPHAGAA
jgi:3-dehydroquinate dehydratase